MITLTKTNGDPVAIAPSAVTEITRASPSGMWHGIRTHVRTTSGMTYDVTEDFDEFVRKVSDGIPSVV